MKILVTGAAGFLGQRVVRIALENEHHVRAMLRPNGSPLALKHHNLETVPGDLLSFPALEQACAGMDAVIHCAAATSEAAGDGILSRRINVDGTRKLYEAADRASVKRWVQISSMSAHPGSTSIYGSTKYHADEVLRHANEGPTWTILRPSLIYGPGEQGLAARMVRVLRQLPIVPVVGSGKELLRPVYVDDVARATCDVLENEKTFNRSYMIGGADEITFNAFMDQLSEGCGVSRPKLHLPIAVCYWLAKAMSTVMKQPPLTVDNVLGVKQMQRVDQAPAERDFSYAPLGMADGMALTFPKQS